MSEYSKEYVKALESAASSMAVALEEAVSIVDDTRLALVNPKYAARSMDDALAKYHAVGRDFSND